MRILIACDDPLHLDALARAIDGLGETVAAREANVGGVARAAVDESPDVALVGVPRGASPERALALIAALVGGSLCPVVVMAPGAETEFVAEAAALGVYGLASSLDP